MAYTALIGRGGTPHLREASRQERSSQSMPAGRAGQVPGTPARGAHSGGHGTGGQSAAPEDRCAGDNSLHSHDALCPSRELLLTIEGFFGASHTPDNQPDASPLSNLPTAIRAGNRDLQFVVAIVPDPIHTHLSLRFDRSIEVIEQAAQAGGYIFAVASFPWDAAVEPVSDDYSVRLAEAFYQETREDQPGVMIFRRAAEGSMDGPLLAIFVVAEKPTEGINKRQFHNALAAIQVLRGSGSSGRNGGREAQGSGNNAPLRLRVFGPTFSGSLYSLAEIARQDDLLLNSKVFTQVEAYSGVASSYDTICSFDAPLVRFATFQESGKYALERFRSFVEFQGYDPDRVAELSEDETAFGNVNPRVDGSDQGYCTARDPHTAPKGLHLYFPRDISGLRAAYEKDVWQPAAEQEAHDGALRTSLPVNLDDDGSDGDSVPPFSAQTAASEQAVLDADISSLRNHRIEFVFIEASNPLDELFLARYLKDKYPGGRIVTFDAERLFGRVADDKGLSGILAVTPYPLARADEANETAVPHFSETEHLHQVFPRSDSESSFNAMLALLQCSQDPKDSGNCIESNPVSPSATERQADVPGFPFAQNRGNVPLPYADFGWPAVAGAPPRDWMLAPPLQLTALARDEYWRIAVLDAPAFAPKAGLIPSTLHALKIDHSTPVWACQEYLKASDCRNYQRHPRSWICLCCFVIAVSLGFLYLLRSRSYASELGLIRDCAPLGNGARERAMAVAAALVVALLVTLIWPYEQWGIEALEGKGTREGVGAGLLFLSALVVPGLLLALIFRRPAGPKPPPVARCFAWLIFSAAALAAIGHFCLGDLFSDRWLILAICLASLLSFFEVFCYRELRGRGTPKPRLFLALSSPGIAFLLFYLFQHQLWKRCPWFSDPIQGLLAYRWMEISSAVSPLVPWLFLVLGGLWWVRYWLAGLALADSRAQVLPPVKAMLLDDEVELPANHTVLGRLAEEQNRKLMGLLSPESSVERRRLSGLLGSDSRICFLPLLVLGAAFASVPDRWHPIQSLEGTLYDLLYTLGLATLLFLLSASLLRFLLAWTQCRRLLRALESLKLRRGFQRLRRVFSLRLLLQPGLSPSDLMMPVFTRELESGSALAERFRRTTDLPFVQAIRAVLFQTNALRSELVAKRGDLSRVDVAQFQRRRAEACGAALRFLSSRWEKETRPLADPSAEGEKGAGDNPLTSQVEEFVCFFFINFLFAVLLRLRYLVLIVVGLFVLILCSFSSYPFEPRAALRSFMVLLFIIILGIVATVYAQVCRDATISYITDTNPGELGSEFWVKMGTFVIIPVVSLLATQYPAVYNALFSWLRPAVAAFK